MQSDEPQWGSCNPDGVHVTLLMTLCSLHFDKPQKIKFIAFIYIYFNQSLDEKPYISAKLEAVKQFHIFFC